MRQVYNKELQIRLAEPAGLLVRLKGVQFYCNLDHVIIFKNQTHCFCYMSVVFLITVLLINKILRNEIKYYIELYYCNLDHVIF